MEQTKDQKPKKRKELINDRIAHWQGELHENGMAAMEDTIKKWVRCERNGIAQSGDKTRGRPPGPDPALVDDAARLLRESRKRARDGDAMTCSEFKGKVA